MGIAIAFIVHRSLFRCPTKPIVFFPYDNMFLLLFHDALME